MRQELDMFFHGSVCALLDLGRSGYISVVFLRITTIGDCDCATLVFWAEHCNYSPIKCKHDFIN
jgi:hypothetical protein